MFKKAAFVTAQQSARFFAPFVIKRGGAVADFAAKVHREILENLKTARVWGEGIYDGQAAPQDHVL